MDATVKAYRDRWKAVAEIERQELQTASLELRWRQLNAVVGLAIGMGIFKSADDEIEVFQRWAKLKEKAANPPSSAHP
jgi:hypothetical protein